MNVVAMIPARLGSQRLKKKNLALLEGKPLIAHAIEKCFVADCFDAVYVNSESEEIGEVAKTYGATFYQRPEHLGNSVATSEQFVYDFMKAVECDAIVQVHSIAPLLSAREVSGFTGKFTASNHDVLLSCIEDQIEVAYKDVPVNFTFAQKTNSQDLLPVQRITWSITGWRSKSYIDAVEAGKIGTYNGSIGFFPVSAVSGHVIKTQQDLDVAEALMSILRKDDL
jgi:CMP-N-acetylneuraminic acid synthetase